jgi:hypothetical protein
MEETEMSKKMALNDEQMNGVTGGTIVPRVAEGGDTLNSFVAKLNADKPNRFTVADVILWNGLDPNTDPNAPLPAGQVLKVYF